MQKIRLEVMYAAYASTPGFNENNPWVVRQGNGIDLAFAGAKQRHSKRGEDTKTLRAVVEWAGRQKLLVQWVEHGQPTAFPANEEEFFDIENRGRYYSVAKKTYARTIADLQIAGEAHPRSVEVEFYGAYESQGAGYFPKTFASGWNVRETT
jgi:hypothetical protein